MYKRQSQGVPFIYAGEEVMRDKKGVHNSFESPDSINAIDWRRKAEPVIFSKSTKSFSQETGIFILSSYLNCFKNLTSFS